VLTGEYPVLEWFKGSALRPLLARLRPELHADFLRELAARFAAAYPPRNGVTLLPFPRIFLVAACG
jgi:trans-aconitate 2-methyltransferase